MNLGFFHNSQPRTISNRKNSHMRKLIRVKIVRVGAELVLELKYKILAAKYI